MSEVAYILGHSEHEIRRLMLQAALLKPITARMLQEAGIESGMRILDLGTGCGDVAMLAAELVGPAGSVVGIDRSDDALAAARERARLAGHSNIRFHRGNAEDFVETVPFDMAIGRYVLIHQADPSVFIRCAASHVRPGGTVAFHEISLRSVPQAYSSVPIYAQCISWLGAAFADAGAQLDLAKRIAQHFRRAGLKHPSSFCEVPVGADADSPIFSWVSLGLRSLLPHIEATGIATAEEVGIDTLEDRLRAAATVADELTFGPEQICCWAKL